MRGGGGEREGRRYGNDGGRLEQRRKTPVGWGAEAGVRLGGGMRDPLDGGGGDATGEIGREGGTRGQEGEGGGRMREERDNGGGAGGGNRPGGRVSPKTGQGRGRKMSGGGGRAEQG